MALTVVVVVVEAVVEAKAEAVVAMTCARLGPQLLLLIYPLLRRQRSSKVCS
jgi:hypothetical protein